MKFNLKDKVKIIKGSIGLNTFGKVIEIDDKFNFPYRVKFKENQGHNFLWNWFSEDELEKVEDEKFEDKNG